MRIDRLADIVSSSSREIRIPNALRTRRARPFFEKPKYRKKNVDLDTVENFGSKREKKMLCKGSLKRTRLKILAMKNFRKIFRYLVATRARHGLTRLTR